MKEFFIIAGALDIAVLLILVFFVLSKVHYVNYTIKKIKRVLKSEVVSSPFDSVTVFNNVLKRCKLKDMPLSAAQKTKFIVCIYDKNNKKNAIYKLLSISNKKDVTEMTNLIRLILNFSNESYDYYIREYKTVPSWIELRNESLRRVDPYDPTLDKEWKRYIILEAKNNPLYYIEMIRACPVGPIGEFIINLSNAVENKEEETLQETITKRIEERTDIRLPLEVAEKFNIGQINTIIKMAKEKDISEIDEKTANNLLKEYKISEDNEKDKENKKSDSEEIEKKHKSEEIL